MLPFSVHCAIVNTFKGTVNFKSFPVFDNNWSLRPFDNEWLINSPSVNGHADRAISTEFLRSTFVTDCGFAAALLELLCWADNTSLKWIACSILSDSSYFLRSNHHHHISWVGLLWPRLTVSSNRRSSKSSSSIWSTIQHYFGHPVVVHTCYML
jgi:hypothetical protein